MPAPSEPAGLYKSILYVRALLGGVAQEGVDPQRLLQEAGLKPGLLYDPSARIACEDWQRLVRRAIELTGDEGLGLKVGGAVPDHAFQIVSQLLVSCGTLREASQVLRRFQPLLGNMCLFDLIEEGALAHFVCTPVGAMPEAPQFEPELVLSVVYRIALGFAVQDEDAEEVWMQHPRPTYADRYAQVFSCPVRFGQPRNAIVVKRCYLDQRQPYSDLRTNELLRASAERLLSEQSEPSLPDQVRALLRVETDLRHMPFTRIAKKLRLQPRTLRRRLVEANAPWSMLLNEMRQRVACDALSHREVSLSELSERLGFSDPSAFSRAFKRWTGTSPGKYSRDAAAEKRSPQEVRSQQASDGTHNRDAAG